MSHPKKLFIRAFIVTVFSAATAFANFGSASAAGGMFYVGVWASGASSVAVGGTLTFVAEGYDLHCANGGGYNNSHICSDGTAAEHTHTFAGHKIYVSVSGSGNTLGGIQGSGEDTYVTIGADGTAQFTVSSSVAEAKTVTVLEELKTDSDTATATFTAAQASTPAKTTPKATTPAPTPAAPTPPVAPTSNLTLNQQPIENTTHPTVQAGKVTTLAGVTVPNGVVKLYIFSTPRTATVTADSTGKWTYGISGLAAGAHHVEAEVTDPATNLTSSRVTLATFTVATALVAAKTTMAAAKKPSVWPWVIGGLGLVVVAGAGTVAWCLRRRAHHTKPADTTPPTTDSTPGQNPPTTGAPTQPL
jgi:hypothetical protein